MKANDFYFCLYLTESEHSFVQQEISEYCTENNLNLMYYRKLKDGHIPMYREVKVTSNDPMGLGKGIPWFWGWLEGMCLRTHRNPHKNKRVGK